MNAYEESGREALLGLFGLSYASWLVLPRVLMQQMPDEWQGKMAALMSEYSAEFPNLPDIEYVVTIKQGGKFAKLPEWVGYRYPDEEAIAEFRKAA